MTYSFSKRLPLDFEAALARTVEALEAGGFGVISQIDLQATFKKKLDEDVGPYVILGACNPRLARQALAAEDKIGLMLPCNVVVQARDGGSEVSAIDPVAAMGAIPNPELQAVATVVAGKLKAVIDAL